MSAKDNTASSRVSHANGHRVKAASFDGPTQPARDLAADLPRECDAIDRILTLRPGRVSVWLSTAADAGSFDVPDAWRVVRVRVIYGSPVIRLARESRR